MSFGSFKHYSKLQYSMLLFLGLRARFQLTAKLMSTWWLIIAKKIIWFQFVCILHFLSHSMNHQPSERREQGHTEFRERKKASQSWFMWHVSVRCPICETVLGAGHVSLDTLSLAGAWNTVRLTWIISRYWIPWILATSDVFHVSIY